MYHFLLKHPDGSVSVRLVSQTNRHHQTSIAIPQLLITNTLRSPVLRNQLFQVADHLWFYPSRKTDQTLVVVDTPIIHPEAETLMNSSTHGDAWIIPASKVIGINQPTVPLSFPNIRDAVNTLSSRGFASSTDPRKPFEHRPADEWFCYDETDHVLAYGQSNHNTRPEFLMPITPLMELIMKQQTINQIYGCWLIRMQDSIRPPEARGLGRLKQFARA